MNDAFVDPPAHKEGSYHSTTYGGAIWHNFCYAVKSESWATPKVYLVVNLLKNRRGATNYDPSNKVTLAKCYSWQIPLNNAKVESSKAWPII